MGIMSTFSKNEARTCIKWDILRANYLSFDLNKCIKCTLREEERCNYVLGCASARRGAGIQQQYKQLTKCNCYFWTDVGRHQISKFPSIFSSRSVLSDVYCDAFYLNSGNSQMPHTKDEAKQEENTTQKKRRSHDISDHIGILSGCVHVCNVERDRLSLIRSLIYSLSPFISNDFQTNSLRKKKDRVLKSKKKSRM